MYKIISLKKISRRYQEDSNEQNLIISNFDFFFFEIDIYFIIVSFINFFNNIFAEILS